MGELVRDSQKKEVFCIKGSVDYSSVKALTEMGYKLLDRAELEQYTVDFSSVSCFNSALLSMMLCWKRRAIMMNIKIKWTDLPEFASKMAKTYGVEFVLEE